MSPFWCVAANSSQGLGFALLHAEGDTTTFFVDFENHDFNFFAKLNDFLRINVLVCPIHFGNVDQTFNTGFDFNESTVVSDVGNLTEETCALRINGGRYRSKDLRRAV